MFDWLRKRRAKACGIPFEDKTWWPPYYLNFGGHIPGNVVLRDIYDANPGETVPVLKSESQLHIYKVISEGRVWGDDHIVSPRQWHIVYQHSVEF